MQLFRHVILCAAVFLGSREARADLATIYLTNGEARTVELVSAERGQVLWKSASNSGEVQSTGRSQIEHVLFPTTETWRDAEEAFESGDWKTAEQLYQEVIRDPGSHFHPIPGNFVSLAKERLLRIARRRMDPAAVARQAQVVREEFLNLPPEYRVVGPETAAWTAAAKEDWAGVLTALGEVEAPGPEIFYLRGLALESTGKKTEAVSEYAGAYVMNFGGDENLTRESLRRSASLLGEIADEDRTPELQAQLKIFRDLFGAGKLWEGAPENFAALADGEIQVLGEAKGKTEKPASAGGTVASETMAVASLPPAEERDYLLVDEIDEDYFYIGKNSEQTKVEIKGGAVPAERGYRFDGTGGGVLIQPVNAKAPVFLCRIRFVADSTGGLLVALGSGGKQGRFVIRLEEGELVVVWKRGKGEAKRFVVGKVEAGSAVSLLVHGWKNGTLVIERNGEATQHEVETDGLDLGKTETVQVGGSSGGDSEVVGFRGEIQHLSIATGESLVEIEEREIERLGKKLALLPPAPSGEEITEESEE